MISKIIVGVDTKEAALAFCEDLQNKLWERFQKAKNLEEENEINHELNNMWNEFAIDWIMK